jgi:predicted extracellular nuclease
MTNKLILLFIFALSIFNTEAQKQTRTIGFYNVENLFDTIDGINDDAEFLPSSKKEWNAERYNEKLKHIDQVFNEWNSPMIIGLCEIENKAVVQGILSVYDLLKPKKYGIVHYESPDARGIDVALIYDSSYLKLERSGNLRFTIPGKEKPSSRDIVWGKFSVKKDTIIAMVNHWPSRSGGQPETEPGRIEAAKTAKKFIDSLLAVNKNYKIVLMGDLNDHPTDIAPSMIAQQLTPMINKASGEFGGTHSYKDEWDILDHIMVSKGFLKKKKIKVVKASGKIHSPKFLLEEYKGKIVPFRTYAGNKYLGGYSDHLPVSIEVSCP